MRTYKASYAEALYSQTSDCDSDHKAQLLLWSADEEL